MKLHSKPFNLSIVQVYAPTSASSEEDIETFYSDLDVAHKACGSQDMVIVMGDMNAKVGQEQDPMKEIVGRYGLGQRNDRGDLWVDWCTTHEQVIMNTWFQHHQRHLYTWKSPGDVVRNQIDYITINRRFRNSILQVKGYPGADCGSDHVPIVATMKVKPRALITSKSVKKLQIDLLRTNKDYHNAFHHNISEQLQGIDAIDNLEDRYTKFKDALIESAQQVLPVVETTAKQKWMTDEILQKMEQRRLAKGNNALYTLLDGEIRQECKDAKENMLMEQCQLIEQLDAAHKTNLVHSQIRLATGKRHGPGVATCIEDKDGTIIMDKDKILLRWYEYISDLYNDNRGDMPSISTEDTLPITTQEVEYALKGMPMNKAAGPDNITTELLVAAGDIGIVELTKLSNMMYNKGCLPSELNKSIFITLPKVNGTTKCEKHRTISLMSHVTKLILRIVINRIRGRTLSEIAPEQYGFMPDKGTRNAIFVLRRMVERSVEKQRNVYTCFIDYSKAFDTVKHGSLVELLKSLDIDDADTRMLTNLYWNQTAAVRCGNDVSEELHIKQGVRQGCVASPHLFALYTEMIMRNIDGMDGFKIGGTVINNLRYADDTVIIAESEQQLQHLIDVVVDESEKKGLYLNSSKSFTMVFSKSPINPKCNITVHGNPLEQVQSFIYLGSMFTSDARCEKEIRRRIAIAKSTFTSMDRVLTCRNIATAVRLRVLKCYVWSTMMYGCEAWTISGDMIRKLEAAETWFYRRMLRITWTDRVTNEDVYSRMNAEKSLMNTIVQRQMSFLGHVVRKDSLENLVVTGFVDGKRARGRQRETFLTYLSKRKNTSPIELLHLAKQKDIWSKLCA